MCDNTKPRKKFEPPLTALKIMKRIKLEDNKQWQDAQKAKNQVWPEETAYSTTVDNESMGAEEDEWECLETGQDSLVEEILPKRTLSYNPSSFQYHDEEEEEDPETDGWPGPGVSSGTGKSQRFGDSTSLNVALRQTAAKPKASINSIIKERILYHGLNKYPDEYDKSKYFPPIPKPKRRAPTSGANTSTDTPLSADGTSESAISSSTSSNGSEVVFDHDTRSYRSETETKLEIETEEIAGRTQASSQVSMMSIVSKFQPLPDQVASDESIKKTLALLDAKEKEKSLMAQHTRPIPGYPQCVDTTEGCPECLPPGEIVRRAIRPDKLWDIPVNKPLTKEQLIDLIQRIENYPTNDYVYLSYMYRPKTPAFNPYLFKIVSFESVDPKQYFTLSKSGIMHFFNGMAEFTSRVKFLKQIYIFERLRKVPFLMLYPMYKSYRIWRSNICQTRMKKNRKQLDEALFTTKRPLREMLVLLFRMIEKISDMGSLSLEKSASCEEKDFASCQEMRLEIILRRFQAFEKIVLDLTENACRTYLVECGFSADQYIGEVEFSLRGEAVNDDKLTDEVSKVLDYPGQWLPYSLQAKKKRLCERLSNFKRLVDFYVQAAYHRLSTP